MSTEKWFYSIRGRVMGPVTNQQIQTLVASGLLNDGGMVRKASSDSWQRPNVVGAPAAQADSHDSINSAVQDAVNQQRAKESQQRTQPAASRGSSTVHITTLMAGLVEYLSNMLATLILHPVSKIPSTIWKPLTGVIICAAVGSGLLLVVHEWTWRERVSSTVETAWTDYSRLLNADVSREVWDEFRTTVLPELKTASETAQRWGGSSDQKTRDLMRMARDILPALIRAAPARESRLENQYRQFAARHAGIDESAGNDAAGTNDAILRWFLILDGILVVYAVVWFVRSGRNA